MLCVMERMQAFDNLKSEISDFKSICENISRQIRGWADSLQNSQIKGQRHLNDESRREYENEQRRFEFQKRREEFQRELEERVKREAEQRRRAREE